MFQFAMLKLKILQLSGVLIQIYELDSFPGADRMRNNNPGCDAGIAAF
jgi:hypothetical protein